MGYYGHLGVFYNVHYAVTSCIAFYLVGRQLVCEIKLHNVKLNEKKKLQIIKHNFVYKCRQPNSQ